MPAEYELGFLLTQVNVFIRGFILTPTENVTFTEYFERFQYRNFEISFLKNQGGRKGGRSLSCLLGKAKALEKL